MTEKQSFIAVVRPQQSPAAAFFFRDEDDFVSAWGNGAFSRWHANNDDCEPETFTSAWADVGHDLYTLTRLDSPEDVAAHLAATGHNMGGGAVRKVARECGWLVRLRVDDENGDDEWWTALDQEHPAIGKELRNNEWIDATPAVYTALAALPGWSGGPDHAPHPLICD